MEKESRRVLFNLSAPVVFLFALVLLCSGADFLWGNGVPFHRWMGYFSSSETSMGMKGNSTIDEQEFMKFHLRRLVRGDDRRKFDRSGFVCSRRIHSVVCLSNRPVRIDGRNMTVYVDFSGHVSGEEPPPVVFCPYARQEDVPKSTSPVRIVQLGNATEPPPCDSHHRVPAVVFSSGSTGNVFHEMNEIIIPLFITTKHFQSRVQFVVEDYKPSFAAKYGKILRRLSAHEVINPAEKQGILCFPGSVVGLMYHDNLALNSSEIPGGYSMSEFKQFLRQAYDLKFTHVSQIRKPRLMLLSRTKNRRFLNEEEMILTMEEIGFEVIVIRRSKTVSNLNTFSQMINSCSVLVGAHGAGLTNEIFLPSGAVMVQVELLGTEWASNTYYGDTARAMGVRYLRYKVEPEESSLTKMYGRRHPIVSDPGSVYRNGGYRAARTVFLDHQNVRLNLTRFRDTMVEAFSIVSDLDR